MTSSHKPTSLISKKDRCNLKNKIYIFEHHTFQTIYKLVKIYCQLSKIPYHYNEEKNIL